MHITVRLLKPAKNSVISYAGELLRRSPTHVLLRAVWSHAVAELGYVTFAPGDLLYEHFYSDRWYTVFEIHAAAGGLKGWYCNIARPALLGEDVIQSEDLELDLFVPPNRQGLLVLDEDEFAARAFNLHAPATYAAALGALRELQTLAHGGAGPFEPHQP